MRSTVRRARWPITAGRPIVGRNQRGRSIVTARMGERSVGNRTRFGSHGNETRSIRPIRTVHSGHFKGANMAKAPSTPPKDTRPPNRPAGTPAPKQGHPLNPPGRQGESK